MDFLTKYRFDKLKAMHNMMLHVNNENYYMTWIYTVPDEPTEEDFIDIATDAKMYNEVEGLFKRLITQAIKYNSF